MSDKQPHMTRLLAVVPWEAEGPGWRNQGVTGYFEDTYHDGSTRVRQETIQGAELPHDLTFAFRVAVMARKEMERLFPGWQQGVYRRMNETEPAESAAPQSATGEAPTLDQREGEG